MDTTSNTETKARTKRSRAQRITKETKGNTQVSQVDETAARLSTHEQVCAERYKGIETRMDNIETRVDAISADLKELKTTNDQQFNEIKTLLSGAKDEKFKTMVTVAGTVIVALVGLLGYIITHLPK